MYFGFEWLEVPFVFVYDLGAQAAYRDVFLFLPACHWGGQPADRQERSDERDHLCLGQEPLTQPSMQYNLI